MRITRLYRFLPAIALGLGLAALPLAIPVDGAGDQVAFAKNGGNGGGGGGNGGGKGGGHGGGKGNSGNHGGGSGKQSAAATDASPGKARGHVKKEADLAAAATGTGEVDIATTPHPRQLGRLNAFMNASPQALANAAPNSAVGVVAQSYREALAAYAADTGEVPADDPAVVDPALDAAARALALAANKELTPDVVAAVNAHLAETYSDDPALAGYADPASPESQEVAESIAALAEGYQAEETNQGLGAGLDETDATVEDESAATNDGAADTPVDGSAVVLQ